jgi:hypothetical protein
VWGRGELPRRLIGVVPRRICDIRRLVHGGEVTEVIIPVRNMADQLPKVLPPLLDQRADGDVVTVVNAASTDNSEAVARSLAGQCRDVDQKSRSFYLRQIAAGRSAAVGGRAA